MASHPMPLARGPAAQVVVVCVLTQMNYLNKALDLFNTAIVSPIYYVMFTMLTILASIIMFNVSATAQGAPPAAHVLMG